MKSGPTPPIGYGPSRAIRKDARPASFQQQQFGVDAYVNNIHPNLIQQQSAQRIAELQQQQAAVQQQHQQQWGHTTQQIQPYPSHHQTSTAWRGSTPTPSTPPHPPQFQPRPPPPNTKNPPLTSYNQPVTSQRATTGGPIPPASLTQPSSSSSSYAPSSRTRPASTSSSSTSQHLIARPRTQSSAESLPLPTSPSTSNGVTSLKEKVALALADLESIKSKSYRPSTAAASTSSGAATTREPALPRPNIRSSSIAGASGGADSRAAAELRTAKSILRKLYKKNVQLAADIQRLRQNREQQRTTPTSPNESLTWDENEAKLLETNNAPDGDGEDVDDEEDPNAAADDQRTDGDESPSKHRSKSSSSKKDKLGLGGSSHLLFLLGERDTTINKLQAQIQGLNRKINSMTGKLELLGGNSSTDTTGSSTGGSEGLFTDHDLDSYHQQLLGLRESFSEKLRSQMQQLSLMQSAGEPPPSKRLLAYVRDLEQWLIWECSWRQVEKISLNAECMRADKQAQESWVRSRLLERELHELQTKYNTLDGKNRMIDTQLATSLERNKQLEQELLRLRK